MARYYDQEFSLKEHQFLGMYNLVPTVRNQGCSCTCIFNALCAAAEMDLKREEALQNSTHYQDPFCSTLSFSAEDFLVQFKKSVEGRTEFIMGSDKLKICLELFKHRGIYADGTSDAVPSARYNIAGYTCEKRFKFEDIVGMINEGKAFVGSFKISKNFRNLKSNEIYEYIAAKKETNEDGVTKSHCVVFIGYGIWMGRPYLVYLNSHGEGFGDNGFGRIFLKHVHNFSMVHICYPSPDMWHA